MSRTWFFFGLVALTTAISFTGCTITTDTDGGEGGSAGNGGDGGDASGGSAGEGGASSEGGTDQGGAGGQGGAAQGGATQGGAGGQSSTITVEEAVDKACAVAAVSDCVGKGTLCPEYFLAQDSEWPNCSNLYAAYIDCVANTPPAEIECESITVIVPKCATTEETYWDCIPK